ncbi:MAG: hypothetical protein WAW86_05875 [Gammaproteobacteria bacterium]
MFARLFSCCQKTIIDEEDEYLLTDDELNSNEEIEELDEELGLTYLDRLEKNLAVANDSLDILNGIPIVHLNLKTCLPSISTLLLMSGAIATLVLKGLDNAAKKGRILPLIDQYKEASIPVAVAINNATCGDIRFDYYQDDPVRFCSYPSYNFYNYRYNEKIMALSRKMLFNAAINFCSSEVKKLCINERRLTQRDDLLAGFITTAGLICFIGAGYLMIENYYELRNQILITDDAEHQFVIAAAKKFTLSSDWSSSLQKAKEEFGNVQLALVDEIDYEKRRLELAEILREAAQPSVIERSMLKTRLARAADGNAAEDIAKRLTSWDAKGFTSALHIIPNIIDFALPRNKRY